MGWFSRKKPAPQAQPEPETDDMTDQDAFTEPGADTTPPPAPAPPPAAPAPPPAQQAPPAQPSLLDEIVRLKRCEADLQQMQADAATVVSERDTLKQQAHAAMTEANQLRDARAQLQQQLTDTQSKLTSEAQARARDFADANELRQIKTALGWPV